MGANVISTRECDGNVSLEDRIKIAKDNCANIFVSIHLNSIPDIKMNINKNRGTSIYYYNENSKELAKILEDSITKKLKTRLQESVIRQETTTSSVIRHTSPSPRSAL